MKRSSKLANRMMLSASVPRATLLAASFADVDDIATSTGLGQESREDEMGGWGHIATTMYSYAATHNSFACVGATAHADAKAHEATHPKGTPWVVRHSVHTDNMLIAPHRNLQHRTSLLTFSFLPQVEIQL